MGAAGTSMSKSGGMTTGEFHAAFPRQMVYRQALSLPYQHFEHVHAVGQKTNAHGKDEIVVLDSILFGVFGGTPANEACALILHLILKYRFGYFLARPEFTRGEIRFHGTDRIE